jgi:hypothetical protein
MDPEQTLSELRYLVKNNSKRSTTFEEIFERFEALDEWLTKGGFSPWPASGEPNRFADQRARMSDAQRNKLWDMCGRYNVPFREDDYVFDSWNNGMVEGWIGGFQTVPHVTTKQPIPKTIYVGVEPNGDSHT